MSVEILMNLYSIFDNKTNTYCPVISDSIDQIKIDLCNLYLSNDDLHLFEGRILYQVGIFNTSTGYLTVNNIHMFNLIDIPKLDIFESVKAISDSLTSDEFVDTDCLVNTPTEVD